MIAHKIKTITYEDIGYNATNVNGIFKNKINELIAVVNLLSENLRISSALNDSYEDMINKNNNGKNNQSK
jgi:hypothetical protein